MTYFTSWEEFAKAVEKLHSVNAEKCRFVTKYNHRDGKLTMKMTDDVVCVQFSTNQLQDVKRLEKLSASLMRSMVSSHS
ncbi:hypothetical protein V3C99_001200 [Haemonchus contortus]|uniref:Signal recognition particle 9 kDa protein n=2 Tax=Haemonchus TaxID=6288 RepID=A0A0N4WI86_HAEPC|nr:Signal recognition particle domain containing protein [Haemonchus contortus]VDO40746.1 unnamed protein product [Haemonchus placei]